ncbi:MAG: hypothetical protein EXR86_13990 [Gammaproteobacteria bacterium]|nr:hypothetical protein [Gammaproteobacteria bacterium]
MTTSIGVQRRLEWKPLSGPTMGMRPDEIEVAKFSAPEQSSQLCDVLARVASEIRQHLGVAGGLEGSDLGDDGLVQSTFDFAYLFFEQHRDTWDNAKFWSFASD